jgi:esterase/lipase
MDSLPLKINNKKGVALHAYLDLPINQKPSEYAIFGHCFTCSGSLKAVRNISQKLTEHGFGVLRFDFTGLGMSGGEFSDSHFTANVDDILAVHAFMKENYEAPSLQVGHSLGGAATIVAASQLEEIKTLATIGSPSSVSHVKHLFSDQIEDIDKSERLAVNIGGRPFTIDKEFVENFDKVDLKNIIRNLNDLSFTY